MSSQSCNKSIITAESMICSLANACDGANSVDGNGFSKIDSHFGKSLAEFASHNKPWSAKQAAAATKLIKKYQRQLGGKDFIDEWLKSPKFANIPSSPDSAQSQLPNDRKLTSVESFAVFKFNYNLEIVTALKSIKGEKNGKKYWAAWDCSSKSWTVPVNGSSIIHIMEIANKFKFDIEDRFVQYLDKIQEQTAESNTHLILNDNRHITVAGDMIVISVADVEILAEFEKALVGLK